MFGDNTNQTTDNVMGSTEPPTNSNDPLATVTPTNDGGASDSISLPTPPGVPNDDQSTPSLSFGNDTTTPDDSPLSSVPQDSDTSANTDSPAITDNGIAAAAPAMPALPDTDTDNNDEDTSPEPIEESSDSSADSTSEDTGTSDVPSPSTPLTADDIDALVDIKQQALEQLSPLVDKLDQSPEERFRTTMMMIQASDNQELVKQAFEIAQKIEDDKIRAQALLDVINEINYFTTQAK